MVTEVNDPTLVGSAIQRAFLYLHDNEFPFTPHPYPTRVHGPTGKLESWLTFWRIYRLAQDAAPGQYVSVSAIAVRLQHTGLAPVKGVQYEENHNGIQGAWG